VNNKLAGDLGEKEVCTLVPCPNCKNKLVLLPPGFPLYDVQCSRCLFRAQVKTVSSKPRASILGAGWEIYEKVLKAGYLAPPIFINFKWYDKEGLHQRIHFYPFVAKGNIQKYTLPPKSSRAGYKIFRYIKLDKAPQIVFFTLHDGNQKPKQPLNVKQ